MPKQGFSFLEVIVALAILSLALIGLLQMFNTALNASRRANQELIADNLARALMAEIMAKRFDENSTPPFTDESDFGPDSGESQNNRSTLDDVDDYLGYIDSPPETVHGLDLDGTGPRPNYANFTWEVEEIKYVDFFEDGTQDDNPSGPTHYKQVTIRVSGPMVPGRDFYIAEVKAYLP